MTGWNWTWATCFDDHKPHDGSVVQLRPNWHPDSVFFFFFGCYIHAQCTLCVSGTPSNIKRSLQNNRIEGLKLENKQLYKMWISWLHWLIFAHNSHLISIWMRYYLVGILSKGGPFWSLILVSTLFCGQRMNKLTLTEQDMLKTSPCWLAYNVIPYGKERYKPNTVQNKVWI